MQIRNQMTVIFVSLEEAKACTAALLAGSQRPFEPRHWSDEPVIFSVKSCTLADAGEGGPLAFALLNVRQANTKAIETLHGKF